MVKPARRPEKKTQKKTGTPPREVYEPIDLGAVVAIAPPADLATRAAELGIALEGDEPERLGLFLGVLLATTERFNLTAIRDPAAAWERHVLDSLTLMPPLVTRGAATVIDVGSGGGLPGLPLAIVLPSVRFTLLEATGKKARFLVAAAERLGLTNVEVVEGRAETEGHNQRHREHYDAALARALGPLPVLAELVAPFVRTGGCILAIKGENCDAEIASAARAFSTFQIEVAGRTRTPTGTVLELVKKAATPARFPRRPGEPKRAPLG